ncbi:MAG: hypothetical protein ACKO4M_02985, partial [Betaproteobacteria bacterium]
YPAFSSSSDFPTSSSYPTSSTSSTSSATSATSSFAPVAPSQSTKVSDGLEQVQKLMAKIDEFILNPSTEKLSETSQSIKDCLENINFKKLAEYPEYENDLTTLAERVIAFWTAAGTSSNVLSDNQTITLELAAKASYGLDACIKWDKANSIFKKNDWQGFKASDLPADA